MTLQSAPGILWPDPNPYGTLVNNGTAFGSLLIDASAEKVAWVFRAPKAGDIARIHFRTVTVNTGDTLKISLQDIDPTTGNPDGVVDQFRTQVVLDADDNTWFRTGLVTSDGTDTGTLRTVTKGQRLAAVVEFNSFVAGSINIAGVNSQSNYYKLSYSNLFTASWSHQVMVMCMAVEYSDGSFAYIPNSLPASALSNNATTINTTPDELALKFRAPFKMRVAGWWAVSNFGGDADMVLYDSDGTSVLASDSVDKDILVAGFGIGIGFWSSPITLSIDTFYRLALKPTTTTGQTVPWFSVSSATAALMDQLPGGQDAHWSERTDAGAWTDVTTKRPCFGLLLDGLDDSATGGLSRSRVVNAGGM